MRIHNITVFADTSLTPEFDMVPNFDDITFKLKSSDPGDPEVIIFFNNAQEATNFKNSIIQSWESFLRKEDKKKS